jgi:hypothetical protein
MGESALTAFSGMPGVTYRPNLRPSACTWSATALMPPGNLAVSATHRPLPSTTGPLPSHFIQKSSRLT